MSIWKSRPDRGKENNASGIREVTLEDLNLSVRSFNSLKRAGCGTVGDILDAMGDDGEGLRRIRNLGARSEAEIKEKLDTLRLEYPVKAAVGRNDSGIRVVESTGRHGNRVSEASEVTDLSGQETEGENLRIILRPARAIWDREIGEFHLSHYAEDRLRSCGIRTLRDLYATHPKNEPGWYAVRELFRNIAEFG